MARFSVQSLTRLESCDIRLVRLFMKVIDDFNCAVICGYRGEEEQNEAFRTGHSQCRFPQSNHNKIPSLAVDVLPWPVTYGAPKYAKRCYLLAGVVLAHAKRMNIDLRWGGDWDRDTEIDDQTFDDLAHFELVEKTPNTTTATLPPDT